MKTKEITIFKKENTRVLSVAGGNYKILMEGAQTNNTFSMFEMLVPPGSGPTPHEHKKIQEIFYILEGEMTFKTEKGHSIVKTGESVLIPFGGGAHSFFNHSDNNVKMMCMVMPSGLEDVFNVIGQQAITEEFLQPKALTDLDKEKLEEFNRKYEQRIFPEDYLD